MPPIIAPIKDFRLSPDGRANRRAAARAGVFGAVDPLTIFPNSVDVGWDGIDLPTGVDHIDRLVFENTGGREGSPIYAHVLYPTATAIGKAMIFLCGHWHGGWNTYYTLDMETSIPLRMLARGWSVVMVDMPNYGLQPTQATWYQGSVHTMAKNTFHWPNGGILDDGFGNTLRLFYDHCFGITNWANAPIVAGHPEQGGGIGEVVCLAGQSGGAAMAGQYSAMEERIKIWHIMQGGNPVAQSFSTVDAEQMTNSTIEIALGVSMLLDGDSMPFYAGVPGRIVVMHAADADEYTGDNHLQWEDVIPRWAARLAPTSTLAFNRKTTGTHSIDATQAAFVENHLVTYG